jgi:tetraacyldisaccharide 4'-kinase
VVTKCPPVIAPVDRKNYIERIRPSAQQRVYFSKIRYEKLKPVFPETTDELCEGKHVSSILLFAGIANIYPLEEQIKRGCTYMETIRYPDHHRYSASDLKHIRERFTNIVGRNKILVTTEKDRMRISEPGLIEILKDIPLYEQPIEVEFFREDGEWFDKQIKEYAGKNQTKC